MKKLILAVALVFSVTLSAQEKITEGVVTSKQTMSSANEEVNAQLAMMGNMITITYFKDNKSRSELSNPMIGTTITIMDNDANKMLKMMDNPMMGKKYALKDIEPSEEDLKIFTIKKGAKTKTVLGYVCNEYLVSTTKDGVALEMTFFTTEKISASSQQSATFGKTFKGFPMYMQMTMNQMGMEMQMTYEVTEVKNEKVSSNKFDMTPLEGYEKTDNLRGM